MSPATSIIVWAHKSRAWTAPILCALVMCGCGGIQDRELAPYVNEANSAILKETNINKHELRAALVHVLDSMDSRVRARMQNINAAALPNGADRPEEYAFILAIWFLQEHTKNNPDLLLRNIDVKSLIRLMVEDVDNRE